MSTKKLNYDIRVFVISGYSWSGSSAMVDLLKEFKGFKAFQSEFRLLHDPGGILEMENAILNIGTPNSINSSINRFRNLINALSRRNSWEISLKQIFYHFGFSYNYFLNNKFLDISNQYIKNLVQIEYNGALLYDLYDLSYLEFLLFKIKYAIRMILGKKVNKKRKIYYCNLDSEKFYKITRNYLYELLKIISYNGRYQNIILDQAFSPINYLKCIKYFTSPKIFIIDRDPRDIFVEVSKLKTNTSVPTDNVETFIKWFKLSRNIPNIPLNLEKSILKLKFEDLVLNYEQRLKEIYNFLGTNGKSSHINKKKFFNPDISKRNIGLWKNFDDQSSIKKIKKELSSYCWEI